MAGNVTALAPREAAPVDISTIDLTAIERVIVAGDLSKLTPEQRWDYYKGVCQSVGLNPFTKPFEYITLNNKLTLYALKGATDQLRGRYSISLDKPTVEISDGLCMVSVSATGPNGRCDSDMGAVSIDNLRGEGKANAIMKAITKAKRRVTLSFCGLGMLDETEIESIPNAQPANIETIPPSAPRASTPARPVQQQPEPAPSEEERARAMVGPDAGTVAALREQAIIRYHQLAAISKEREHAAADKINAVAPESLSPAKLAAAVKKLEEYFPDVPEVGAESLDEAF